MDFRSNFISTCLPAFNILTAELTSVIVVVFSSKMHILSISWYKSDKLIIYEVFSLSARDVFSSLRKLRAWPGFSSIGSFAVDMTNSFQEQIFGMLNIRI